MIHFVILIKYVVQISLWQSYNVEGRYSHSLLLLLCPPCFSDLVNPTSVALGILCSEYYDIILPYLRMKHVAQRSINVKGIIEHFNIPRTRPVFNQIWSYVVARSSNQPQPSVGWLVKCLKLSICGNSPNLSVGDSWANKSS